MKLLAKYKVDLQVDSMDGYKEAVLSFLEPNKYALVLDLGCSNCAFTKQIRYRIGTTKTMYGIDIEPCKSQNNTIVWNFDLNSKWDTESEVFDVVVASQVIEHIWNTDAVMREIYRVLKPNGYAIFSTPNLASWHNIAYLFLGKQPETLAISDELYPEKERPGHRRVATLNEFVKLLEFHKFKIEGTKGSSYHPLPPKLARIASKLNKSRASTITVKVRKSNG